MERDAKGVYFHPETNEILRVSDAQHEPGDGWLRISEDDTLGLLAARELVHELRLVEDATSVYWFGMRGSSPEGERDLSALVCRFKRDVESTEDGRPGGSGLLDRLRSRLKALLEGRSSDSGPASPLVPASIPVRARDEQSPRA